MDYYIKLFWEDEIHGPACQMMWGICRTNAKLKPFSSFKECKERFRVICKTAQRLYDLGKPNQYYKAILCKEEKNGNVIEVEKWVRVD